MNKKTVHSCDSLKYRSFHFIWTIEIIYIDHFIACLYVYFLRKHTPNNQWIHHARVDKNVCQHNSAFVKIYRSEFKWNKKWYIFEIQSCYIQMIWLLGNDEAKVQLNFNYEWSCVCARERVWQMWGLVIKCQASTWLYYSIKQFWLVVSKSVFKMESKRDKLDESLSVLLMYICQAHRHNVWYANTLPLPSRTTFGSMIE